MDPSSTIVAVASPPGPSLRGIVRVSGEHAFELLRAVQVAGAAAPPPGPAVSAVRVGLGGRELPALLVTFTRPRSYTGEDGAELQATGQPRLLERLADGLIDAGRRRGLDVRRAAPGEFTARAFFNDRLTLTEAEGVAATIAACGDAELEAAALLRRGGLGARAERLSEEVADVLALVEAGIDFADEEDVVAIEPGALTARLGETIAALDALLARSVPLEQLRAVPAVVLAGEPNAGKSALFNALLGHRRAVVCPVAGTTRDVLREPLAIETGHGRAEVMLVDVAGSDDDGSELNRRMQACARAALEEAELVVRCVPVDRPPPDPVPGELLVRTKADGPERDPASGGLRVSARRGAGLDALRRRIAEHVADRAVSLAAGAVALQPRHESSLRSARAQLAEALAIAGTGPPAADPALVAAALRLALDDLGELAGRVTPDDVLGRVFAAFCVGK